MTLPRIVGGYSTHDRHKPDLCDPMTGRCGPWRCVDCCGVEDDRDIEECQKCGKQKSVRCSFDDDFA
jgi:hypothetical protein